MEVLPFTQQGIEKYNDRLTKMYFRCVCMVCVCVSVCVCNKYLFIHV